jgi:hypothetical protein
MAQATARLPSSNVLKLTATLAATSGALQQTLLVAAKAHGAHGTAWLNHVEAQFVRSTKNMTFTGTPIEAEAAAVECALANLKMITTAVRKHLGPPQVGAVSGLNQAERSRDQSGR